MEGLPARAALLCVCAGGAAALASRAFHLRPRRLDRFRNGRVVSRRHDVHAGDAGNGRELLDQLDADAHALVRGIGRLIHARDQRVGDDGAEQAVLYPSRGFCRARRRDADEKRELPREAGRLQRRDVAAHDRRIHAELRLHELGAG
jgi:hypothetical protein